ncbi:MAG: family 43 glycosylhydrolase [Clostridia bacterium]|nr:family 43 glycosylhydrolase [Clostridia bacterium]
MKKLISLLLISAGIIYSASCAGQTGDPGANTSGEQITSKEPETMEQNAPRDVIVTNVFGLRDPFVLKSKKVFYMYGTGWSLYATSGEKIDGRWHAASLSIKDPPDFAGTRWAPEVYEYRGEYYMITTYSSSKTNRHGCAVFRSASPRGEFVLHSDGHVTPPDWDALDCTLYIDGEGQPWMIFVHEWISTDDNIGRMACAKMSDDLSEFISEPVELFRATDAPWHTQGVTDGPFIHKCADGSLIMLWSNWDSDGYCVGKAKSPDGSVTGPWIQLEDRLYSKSIDGDYDGGHGMIFEDFDGRLWLVLHSPNNSSAGRSETPVLIPLKEENNDLVREVNVRP